MNDTYGVATAGSCVPVPAPVFVAGAEPEASAVSRNPELWLYRERTIALLRRYLRISIAVGRLPSLLGRELFRSKVTSYRMTSLEDGVIFVHDVERALEQLTEFGRQLIAVILFQEYTQEEAAEVLCCTRRLPGISRSCRLRQRTIPGGRAAKPPADRACGKLLSRGQRGPILRK